MLQTFITVNKIALETGILYIVEFPDNCAVEATVPSIVIDCKCSVVFEEL